MQAGFELKKKVEKGHIPQAIGQLIVANILLQQPVFIVLTDLEVWYFYWLEKNKKVIQFSTDLLHAISLVENTLVGNARSATSTGSTGSTGSTTAVNELPIERRCNFRSYLPQNYATSENIKEYGLEQFLKRPKIDFEFEEDVTNMSDFFDDMDPDEIRNWKVKRSLKFLAETPGFKSDLLHKEYMNMFS